MNYTVLWQPDALNELAAIWTESNDRNAVAAASRRIDLLMADDPLDVGESRHTNHRLAFVPPLQVMFRVFAADSRVEVVAVGLYGK